MSRRYHFADAAKRDLKDIAAYIGKDNKAAAIKMVSRLREVCRSTLVMFPNAGTRRRPPAIRHAMLLSWRLPDLLQKSRSRSYSAHRARSDGSG
jgi:plasmid stabilization system protein ParE